jgi:hypothetical protein
MGALRGRVRSWGLALLLALPMSSCGSSGEECDRCSSDDDCTSGLVCATFSDGSRRCASGTGATDCKVR